MESFFSKNIKLIREMKGIKQDSFEQIGIKKGTYSNYENGKTEPNLETLMSISKFLGLDLNSLICVDLSKVEEDELLNKLNLAENNGKVKGKVNGKVLNENGANNTNADISPLLENTNKVIDSSSPADYLEGLDSLKKEVKVRIQNAQLHMPDILSQQTKTSVPFYNLPVSAGMLGMLESEVFTKNTPDGFLELSVFNGCEAVFPIVGVSMEPIISSGDWIGIKSIDNISRSWDFIQTDVIYLIITHEDRMIKFIDKATDDDFIVCRSANASPFKVYKGDILKLYRVKACVKDL